MKKFIRIAILTAALVLMCTMFASAASYDKPTGLKQVSDSTNSVKIQWDADLNASKYAVQFSTDGRTWGDTADISYYCYNTTTKLSAGKTYYVRVAACDTYYNSNTGETEYDPGQWSEPIDVVTSPVDVGDTVKFTSATTSSVTVKWSKAAGATGYLLEKKLSSQSGAEYSEAGKTSETTKKISNLKADTEYNIRVFSYRKSSSGYTAYSDYYGVLNNLPTVSGKVSGLKVESTLVNTQKMSFKWSKKNVVDGYQIEMYNLKTKKSTKKNITYNTSSSQYYDVSPLTFYKVRIRSYVVTNDGTKKYSAWSAYNYVHLQQEVTGEQVGRKAKVKINWKKVAGADKYKIYVATSFNGTYKLSGTTKNTSFTITKCGSKSLKKGKTYYIRLVAEKKVNGKTYKTTVGGSQSIYLYK